jgi:hypothetical protein
MWAVYFWFKGNRACHFSGVPAEFYALLRRLVESGCADESRIASFCSACLFLARDPWVITQASRYFPGAVVLEAATTDETALCCIANYVCACGFALGVTEEAMDVASRILATGTAPQKRYAATIAITGLAARAECFDREALAAVREAVAEVAEELPLDERVELDSLFSEAAVVIDRMADEEGSRLGTPQPQQGCDFVLELGA